MFTPADSQRRIFYYAAPKDLPQVELIDQSFEDVKRQCHLMRGSLEDFSLLEEMKPEEQTAALASLKRQNRLLYGAPMDFSQEDMRAEEKHLASFAEGMFVLVILVSRQIRKSGLLADPLFTHEMLMRRWRGTGVVVGVLLEAVDEQLWPGQMSAFFKHIPFLGGGKPLSLWEDLEQGFSEIRLDFLQIVGQMWEYKAWLADTEARPEEAQEAYQEANQIFSTLPKQMRRKEAPLSEPQHLEQTLLTLDEILLLDPAFASLWITRGKALQKLHRLEEALESYQEAVRLRPTNPDAWQLIEQILKTLGRKQEAQAARQRARQLDQHEHSRNPPQAQS